MYYKSNDARTKYLESIKDKYLNNQLSDLKAHWYESWESINNSDIRDWEKPEYRTTSLFLNADINTLIEKQDPSRKQMFNYRKMYNPKRYDAKTSSILDAWNHKTPLLPPRITLSDKGYFLISDGLHRTNAALCLNESTIPFFVENKDIIHFGLDVLDELGKVEMIHKSFKKT